MDTHITFIPVRPRTSRTNFAFSKIGMSPKLSAIFCRSRVHNADRQVHPLRILINIYCASKQYANMQTRVRFCARFTETYETSDHFCDRPTCKLGPNVEIVVVGRCIYRNSGKSLEIESSSRHIFKWKCRRLQDYIASCSFATTNWREKCRVYIY